MTYQIIQQIIFRQLKGNMETQNVLILTEAGVWLT